MENQNQKAQQKAAEEKAAAEKLAAEKAAEEKAAAEKLAAEKAAEEKAAAETSKVDPTKYDKYTSLKFLFLSGAKVKDEVKKELETLEAELKLCAGAKPVRTVRAAIKNEHFLLVEGVPVPQAIEAAIKIEGSEKYYFG